jgi:hypothetical protein
VQGPIISESYLSLAAFLTSSRMANTYTGSARRYAGNGHRAAWRTPPMPRR